MKYLIFFAISTLISTVATSALAKSGSMRFKDMSREFALCHAVSPDKITYGGSSESNSATAMKAQKIMLSEDLKGGDDVLTAEIDGVNGKGDSLSRSFDARLTESLGADYKQFVYMAKNEEESIHRLQFEVEIYKRDEDKQPEKIVLSIFAINKKENGTLVYSNSRFLCDYVNPAGN